MFPLSPYLLCRRNFSYPLRPTFFTQSDMNTSLASRRITACSQRILRHVHHVPSPPEPSQGCPSLTLPNPLPLTDHLVAAGWERPIARRISDILMLNATELKTRYEGIMNQAIKECVAAGPWPNMQEGIASLHASYRATYKRALDRLTTSALQRVSSSIPSISAPVCTKNSLPVRGLRTAVQPVIYLAFFQNISVLEKMFLHNSYPTRDEKQTIAGLTGMEYKQVHTWV